MPKRYKTGPPYTDVPEEVYVVVTNPWGMESNPRLRGQPDFDRIASWAQFVLQEARLGGGRVAPIECIYSMGTRDEIIIQFSAGTDIVPLLGEHPWANFSKRSLNPSDSHRSTCVFVYNWRNNGDPTNHNWREHFPASLPLNTVPAKSPYPPPSWASPPPTLTNFVHSIPRPRVPPPIPNPGENRDRRHATPQPPCTVSPSPPPPEQENQPGARENHMEQDPVTEPAITNLFTPYQQHSQYPSRSNLLDRQLSDGAPSSQPPTPPKFIKKLDPYELEEDAFNILRSPTLEEETKDVLPSSDYQPSVKLEAEVNAYLQNTTTVKTEEDATTSLASSGYRPSAKLEDEVNAFLQHATAVKTEYKEDVTTASANSGYRPSAKLEDEVNAFLQHATSVKTEYKEDVTTSSASSGYRPSAKLEDEINTFLRHTTTVASPSPIPTVKKEYKENVAISSASRSTPLANSSYQPSAKLEAEISAFLQHTTTASSPVVSIKREYEEDMTLTFGGKKRTKLEK